MPVTWPNTLPVPLRNGLKITPNPDAKARDRQSGRKVVRRWGRGKGDTLTCTLRLWHAHPQHGDQVALFERYWDRELNFGRNWIDAGWLEAGLGYTGSFLRLIGYSQVQGAGQRYIDYAVTFEIGTLAKVSPDIFWLARGDRDAGYAFDHAAVWVAGDIFGVAEGGNWRNAPLGARHVAAAQIWGRASGTTGDTKGPAFFRNHNVLGPVPCVRTSDVSSTNHNNGTSYILYVSGSSPFVAQVGDKAVHSYVYAPGTSSTNDSGYNLCGFHIINFQATTAALSFYFNNQLVATVNKSLLQNHDSKPHVFIVSMLYRHANRAVKVFVEGVEIYSGSITNQITSFGQGSMYQLSLLNSTYNSTPAWAGTILENAYNEQSVQGAIDLFNTL